MSLALECHSVLSAPICTSSPFSSCLPAFSARLLSPNHHNFGLHLALGHMPFTQAAVPASDFQLSLCLSSNYLGNLLVSGQPVEWLALNWSYFLFLVPTSVVRRKSHLARSYWLEWSLWERMWDGQENRLLKKKQFGNLLIRTTAAGSDVNA